MHATYYFLPIFIMHYLLYVFVPGGAEPEAAVAEALAPYDECLEVAPYRIYFDSGEIADMARHFGLRRNQLQKLAQRMPDWTGQPGGVGERGLFTFATHNPKGRWDWYRIGGRWRGILPNNVMRAGKLARSKQLAKLIPHSFLDPSGVWHSRDRYVADPYPLGRLIEVPKGRWLKRFQKALVAHPDHDVVVVDIHC